jgi:hypothetical protein
MTHHDWRIPGQLTLGGPPPPSPRIVRALRRGPRTRYTRVPRPRQAPKAPEARALAEWHDMTAGQQLAEWAGLRAWVRWLHDRYELSADDRLPACWPAHPGLVEELYALKVWRKEIYTAPQPSGQAARYWHAELRQVLHAATSVYAAGCRTGHRSAPRNADGDTGLLGSWASRDPLTGVPATDLTAGVARAVGSGWTSAARVAQALDTGEAQPVGDIVPDGIAASDGIWIPAADGWTILGDP